MHLESTQSCSSGGCEKRRLKEAEREKRPLVLDFVPCAVGAAIMSFADADGVVDGCSVLVPRFGSWLAMRWGCVSLDGADAFMSFGGVVLSWCCCWCLFWWLLCLLRCDFLPGRLLFACCELFCCECLVCRMLFVFCVML